MIEVDLVDNFERVPQWTMPMAIFQVDLAGRGSNHERRDHTRDGRICVQRA
jgi:hypothetical protein